MTASRDLVPHTGPAPPTDGAARALEGYLTRLPARLGASRTWWPSSARATPAPGIPVPVLVMGPVPDPARPRGARRAVLLAVNALAGVLFPRHSLRTIAGLSSVVGAACFGVGTPTTWTALAAPPGRAGGRHLQGNPTRRGRRRCGLAYWASWTQLIRHTVARRVTVRRARIVSDR
jgi:hypothetical protein